MNKEAVPAYLQIADKISSQIEHGELPPGHRLSTQRDLAYRLKVSLQTVFRAYAELERRGLVVGEVGRGTFVQYFNPERVSKFIVDKAETDMLDLSAMAPIVSRMHGSALKETLEEIAGSRGMARLFEYRPIIGLHLHRKAVANWLSQAGTPTNVENIMIVNGAQHGLLVALMSVAEAGDTIVASSLVDSAVVSMAAALKLRLIGLRHDQNGIVPSSLDEVCRKDNVKALCVTPNRNNPTVATMDEQRRREIAALAERHGVWIIEDDVFGPLMERPLPSIASRAPNITFYVTSFSKCVTHSLRIGYVVAPQTAMDRLASRLRLTGWMSNSLASEIAMRWICDGTAERLIAWQRSELKKRHSVFDVRMKEFDYFATKDSLHIWMTLPGRWRSGTFVQFARASGLLVTAPDPFIVGRDYESHSIRITIGDSVRSDQEFRRGLELLKTLLKRDPEEVAVV